MLSFDWDERNLSHLALHGIAPEEAEQVILNEPLDIESEIRNGECRQVHLGRTSTGRVLVVVTMDANQKTRVVTAWPAKKRLRAFWRSQQEGKNDG